VCVCVWAYHAHRHHTTPATHALSTLPFRCATIERQIQLQCQCCRGGVKGAAQGWHIAPGLRCVLPFNYKFSIKICPFTFVAFIVFDIRRRCACKKKGTPCNPLAIQNFIEYNRRRAWPALQRVTAVSVYCGCSSLH